jgi:hypothetical protein
MADGISRWTMPLKATMPLIDHFQPPLSNERRWESFHSSWATRIADALTERWLPPNYIAEENVHLGPSVEIDVGTVERESPTEGTKRAQGVATVSPALWAPPAPDAVLPSAFPDTFEVQVICTDTGPKLVAAIELISPGNKDRLSERRAFAVKCASYLSQGVGVIIIDIVTNRRANLHNELLEVMQAPEALKLDTGCYLYAVAYRPLRREGKDEIDIWRSRLGLGKPLPELPLGLRGDLVVPVEFESTYEEVCNRKRLIRS